MLSLYKLEIFVAVVQEGSFSGAAKRLFITQPAVSQHIHDLEASLGTKLINRHKRGAVLTDAGETLYGYTKRILELVADAEAAVIDVEKLASGQLSVGATPGISSYLLPEWVGGFRERFPNLAVSIQTAVTTDIVAGVMNSTHQLGFVEGELESHTSRYLGRLALQKIELALVVSPSHAWANQESVSIYELQDQPFVVRQPQSRTRVWQDNLMSKFQVKPRIVGEFDNLEAIKQAIQSNLGVGILPVYSIHRELKAGFLCELSLHEVELARQMSLLWDKRHPLTPIARAFLGYLQASFPAIKPLIS